MLGKYVSLDKVEMAKIEEFFANHGGIAGDVGWPGQDQHVGFVPGYMLYESDMIDDDEMNGSPDVDGVYGFWTTDESTFDDQCIMKTEDGWIYEADNVKAENLNLETALALFKI